MNAKKKLVSAKNKIVAHKTHILGTALAISTAAAVLSQIGLRQHDKFLKENDLYDTYYTPDEN